MQQIIPEIEFPAEVQKEIDAIKAKATTEEEAEKCIADFHIILSTRLAAYVRILIEEYDCDENLLPPSNLAQEDKMECAWVHINFAICGAQYDAYAKVVNDAVDYNELPENKTKQKKDKDIFVEAIDQCYAALYAPPSYHQFKDLLHNYQPDREDIASPERIAHELVDAWSSKDKRSNVKRKVRKQKPETLSQDTQDEMLANVFEFAPDQLPTLDLHILPEDIRSGIAYI